MSSEYQSDEQQPGLSIADVLSAVFKHKWKIIFFTLVGIGAAAAVFVLYPPVYESQAKLLVRYVLDRSSIDAIDTNSGKTNDNVIGSEVEILTSRDLAVQAAEAVGVKRLLPEAGANANSTDAAAIISAGLGVVARKGSDIIFVSYRDRNPELVTEVLDQVVARYFTKHLEVHRSAGAFDFVTQQTDQLRARLNQTEDALKALKTRAGISSVATNSATLSAEIVRVEDQFHAEEAELAEQQARVAQMEGVLPAPQNDHAEPVRAPATPAVPSPTAASVENSQAASPSTAPSVKQPARGKGRKAPLPTNSPSDPGAEQPDSGVIQQYQALATRLGQLRDTELELLSKYTPENQLVKVHQSQIEGVESQKRALEQKYPDLASKAPIAGASQGQMDLETERARLAGTKAKAEMLKSRLTERIKQLSDVGSQIADLERKKELEETNYKYYEGTLEKARVDEALDPSKMPNISAVQKPSPPIKVFGKRNKVALGLAGGGLGLGLALALLSELVLNRTFKRARELEQQLGAPVLLSIPLIPQSAKLRLGKKNKTDDSALVPHNGKDGKKAPWEIGHFIRPYSDAIRDRLSLYFELNRMTHKPKLVGVTGFSEGAGSSTLAAGLAAALSEMDEGKVLLVDVNLGHGKAHTFFDGKPSLSLTAALHPDEGISSAGENLYLAAVAAPGAGPTNRALKRFFDLMPNLKASDFDYIIFDMPPLTETSPTFGMAGFMDKVLLIVEAEKINREVVKRSHAQLVSARDNVSVVLNKRRSYVPKWLDGDV